MIRHAAPAALACLLAACHPGGGEGAGNAHVPGDTSSNEPFQGIAPTEELRFTGTEPFWGGAVKGTVLTYSTPETPGGETVTVQRFAGRGGLSFSGHFHGDAFDMMVTGNECSDGMSDRTYPFTVTLRIGAETRNGCAWSEQHPFTGPEQP